MRLKRRISRLTIIVVAVAIGFVALAATAVGADVLDVRSSEDRIADPGQEVPAGQDPLFVPSLQMGLSDLAFTDQQADKAITAADQRPVGQLTNLAGLPSDSVEAAFPEQWVDDGEMVGFNVLSYVRYAGDGHTIVVVTARSTAAVGTHPLLLGKETIELADGTVASTMTVPQAKDTPNQVTFERDGLLVSVASDLSFDELKEIAAKVAVTS